MTRKLCWLAEVLCMTLRNTVFLVLLIESLVLEILDDKKQTYLKGYI